MVPWIVDGELEKIETQKAHQSVIVADIKRGATLEKVNYTVNFAPPDRLRYEFQRDKSAGAALVLCVSTETFLLYDALSKQAERIVNLPPFSRDTFVEFRKISLRNSLEQNKAYAENASDGPGEFWEIRTEPKEDSIWPFETVSYISKETKNNVRGLERDKAGEVVNRFETTRKRYDVDFEPAHFRIQLPTDCAIVEYDLAALGPFAASEKVPAGRVPEEIGGLTLTRGKILPDRRIFDYTQRQKVLLFAERRYGETPLLKSPISREVDLAGAKAYINYAGSYTTCRWRTDGWERLVFTNLGPELALSFAEQVTPVVRQKLLEPAPGPAGAESASRENVP